MARKKKYPKGIDTEFESQVNEFIKKYCPALKKLSDGKNLIVSPVESGKKEKRFREALEKVNRVHGRTLRKLAK